MTEAEEVFSFPLLDPLPDGVFIVASARADESIKPEPEYLLPWTSNASYLHLSQLSHEAIADYLRHFSELVAFAADEGFVTQIAEKTEGFPLYLHYLMEELVQVVKTGQDVRKALEQMPRGFKEYVSAQIKRLDEMSLSLKPNIPERIWPFFALLAVAKGSLRREEIKAKALIGLRDRELRQLPLIWQVARWLLIKEEESTTFYGFAHPLLAEAFADALGDDAQEMRKRLLAFCEAWRDHKSRYALQHYADHLQGEQRYDMLFALARNETFRQAQIEVLSDDPDLPLRTLRVALVIAIQIDNAGVIAEFLLLHTRLLERIGKQTPLDALRAGSLQRAWNLADLYEIERCVFWHLLLAWELKDEGRLTEAQATLERLQKKNVPSSLKYLDCATLLLAFLLEISQDTFAHPNSRLFCEYLIDLGHRSAALEIAQSIPTEDAEAEALAGIAILHAKLGQLAAARKLAGDAYQAIQKIKPGTGSGLKRDFSLKAVANAFAYTGDTDRALAIAQEIHIDVLRENAEAETQAASAIAHAWQGKFAAARQIAQIVGFSNELRARTIVTVALAQALAGEREAALENFHFAIGTGSEWDAILVEAVKVYAWGGEFESALTLTDRIGSMQRRVAALAAIAVIQAQLQEREAAQGTFAQALEYAHAMRPTSEGEIGLAWEAFKAVAIAYAHVGENAKARSVVATFLTKSTPQQGESDRKKAQIAIILAQGGRFLEALAITQRIKDPFDRRAVLATIAEAQAREGKAADALSTIKGIDDDVKRMEALKDVAQAQAQAGEFTTSVSIANDIEDRSLRVEALAAIAVAQAQAGERVAAHETVGAALASAQEVDSQSTELFKEEKQMRALAAIAVAQAQIGDRESARSTFNLLQEAINKIRTAYHYVRAMTQILAVAQAQAGQREAAQATFSEALSTAQRMTDKDTWGQMLDIAEAQANVGEWAQARSTIGIAEKYLQRRMKGMDDMDLIFHQVTLAEYQARIGEIPTTRRGERWATVAEAKARQEEGERAAQIVLAYLTREEYNGILMVAEALLGVGDRTNFKRLLVPCAYYWEAVYSMCRLLMQAYPEKAAAVAAAVIAHIYSHRSMGDSRLGLEQLAILAPNSEEVKNELLIALPRLSESKKRELTDLCWMLIEQEYEMEVRYQMEKLWYELATGFTEERHISDSEYWDRVAEIKSAAVLGIAARLESQAWEEAIQELEPRLIK